jgi:hypothetical protein
MWSSIPASWTLILTVVATPAVVDDDGSRTGNHEVRERDRGVLVIASAQANLETAQLLVGPARFGTRDPHSRARFFDR